MWYFFDAANFILFIVSKKYQKLNFIPTEYTLFVQIQVPSFSVIKYPVFY